MCSSVAGCVGAVRPLDRQFGVVAGGQRGPQLHRGDDRGAVHRGDHVQPAQVGGVVADRLDRRAVPGLADRFAEQPGRGRDRRVHRPGRLVQAAVFEVVDAPPAGQPGPGDHRGLRIDQVAQDLARGRPQLGPVGHRADGVGRGGPVLARRDQPGAVQFGEFVVRTHCGQRQPTTPAVRRCGPAPSSAGLQGTCPHRTSSPDTAVGALPLTATAPGIDPHAAMTDDLSLRLSAVVRTDARHRLADY